MITTLDVDREDHLCAVDEVAQIDAMIASVDAKLADTHAELRAHARAAARALIAGETPTSELRDSLTRIGELESVLVGLGELRVIERYQGFEKLAQDVDKTAEALLSEAEALDARFWAIRKGEVDLGEEAKRSDIPRMDALDATENTRDGTLRRRAMLIEEAIQLRSQRAKLKRANAALFNAEDIA